MNLYNTLARRQMLLGQIEEAEGELTPELEEALIISDDRVQEGVLTLLGLRETATHNIAASKAEIERLRDFIASNERAVSRFEGYLLAAANRLGPITAGSYRVSTRASVAVLLDKDAAVPEQYCKLVPAVAEFYQPDRTALRKALEAGAVIEGATLEKRTNLQVK